MFVVTLFWKWWWVISGRAMLMNIGSSFTKSTSNLLLHKKLKIHNGLLMNQASSFWTVQRDSTVYFFWRADFIISFFWRADFIVAGTIRCKHLEYIVQLKPKYLNGVDNAMNLGINYKKNSLISLLK
jgi:hypothetical protein